MVQHIISKPPEKSKSRRVEEQETKEQKRNTAGFTAGETHPCAPDPRGVVALDKRTGAAITKAFSMYIPSTLAGSKMNFFFHFGFQRDEKWL